MEENKRKSLFPIVGGIYAGINLFLLLIFYIPVYVLNVEMSTWYDGWYYASSMITDFVEFVMPIPFAVLLYFTSRNSLSTLVQRTIYFALPKIVYILPYYYLYALSYGYDSVEGLLISLAVTAGGVIISALHVLLLYFVIGFAARRIAALKMRATLPHNYDKKPLGAIEAEFHDEIEKDMDEYVYKRGVFDVSSPIIGGIFAASAVEFIYSLAVEIANTISYLVEYVGDYRLDEVIYIVLCFIMILIELFAAHALGYLTKIFITEKYKNLKKEAKSDGNI